MITAGTNAGVIKEVGEALRTYRYKSRKQMLDIPCIGIASWGYTAGNDQLQDQPKNFSIEENNRKRTHSFLKNRQRMQDYNIHIVN